MIQLKNGAWVNPRLVAMVTLGSDGLGSFEVRVWFGGDPEPAALRCQSQEDAVVYRDELAKQVGGACK